MPKDLERKLRNQGRKKGYTGERLDHYVFGTMTEIEKKQGDWSKPKRVRNK